MPIIASVIMLWVWNQGLLTEEGRENAREAELELWQPASEAGPLDFLLKEVIILVFFLNHENTVYWFFALIDIYTHFKL